MELYEGTFLMRLRDWREQYRDKPALCCENKVLSFRTLQEQAEQAAAVLLKNGFKAGEKAVLWGYNSIEWVIAFLAVTAAGGTAVLMNYGIRVKEAGALAKMVGAQWLLYGTTAATMHDPSAPETFAAAAGIATAHCQPFSFLQERSIDSAEQSALLNAAAMMTHPHDSQVIIYTTGTTAEPKAVQLSAYSILNDANGCYIMLQQDIGDSICNALPLFHSYGLLILFAYLSCGRTVYLVPLLKPDKIAALLHDHVIDDMASVGTIYEMLTRLPHFSETVASHLNIGIVGGGFTSPTEMMRLEQFFQGTKILCGYGQTECSPVISVERADDPLSLRAHAVGHILPGLDVRIWDEQKGFVRQGETGEIVVKGYCTMNGYYGRSRQEGPFDQDGWLHTGDIGRMIGEDVLQLTGRLKEIIVRCGENISPTEVEQALLSIKNIRSAKVLGWPHPIWGESIEACIVWEQPLISSQEETQIAEDILRQLRQKLSSYKLPSHIFFFEHFPLTTGGKTDRRALLLQLEQRMTGCFHR
ncbi:MAG: class I adenylate-forming enzyme family protein [Acutalibacteraceae bacterium]|nr:class I adenylate-forming enzyme family protein [Acutalibacteraceae bacterium]